MGRTHNVLDFQKTVATIQEYGIKNISADIIVGYPGQKLIDIKETINFLVKLGIPHISAYMLQVEDGTRLKTLVDNGSMGLPDEDIVIDMYNSIVDMLAKAGYDRYELSNFAKPTFESYHNKIYWKRKDYLGIGLAAHSYIEGTRFANTENIAEYVAKLETMLEIPIALSKNLSIDEQKEEAVMLSLRTANGLDLTNIKQSLAKTFWRKTRTRLQCS